MTDVAVSEALFCANHPRVETLVRCSRCEKPICPRCMISTPVGMRCRECANLQRPPIYQVGGRYLWRAAGAALGLAAAASFVFDFALTLVGRSVIFGGLLYAITGFAVAELIGLAANRKRGPILQGLAIASVLVITESAPLLALVIAGRWTAGLLSLLLTAVACAVAWQRLR
ncbi:MAG: hypothetical protein JOZ39_00895 [Chloroflexi bacterium]|nr:hypothetical protein [Chloroflexota bacterium]